MIRLLEATARAERDHFWFRGFRRFVEPLVADAAGASSLDILDCGCGTGHNLTWLRRYGRAYGIDLTWAGLQFARQRGERLTARATAAHLPFASERFDLVTSFDVLYALDDATERQAIAEMARVLKPGGTARRQRRSARLSPRESLYSFGRSAPLQQGGPSPAPRSGGICRQANHLHEPDDPAARRRRPRQAAPRADTRNHKTEIAIPPAPVNAALSGMLALEAAALRVTNMPLGSSLLGVAEKRGNDSPLTQR